MPKTTNIPLQFVNLWLTLFIIWLIANNTLALDSAIAGMVISAFIAMAFAAFSQVYSVVRWSPTVIYYYLMYLSVFLIELVKANFSVMLLVFSPRINIRPAIVEIKTELKSPMGRLALANTITLTPGTLVVDIKDDSLFIHWINISTTDPVEATEAIAGRFEKYLKVIYG
jgi:multicomponent Na+:H+ antiporter subunit E